MTQLELNQYEFNILLDAIKNEYHKQISRSQTEKPLSEHDKKCGIISYKQASEQTNQLLEKLGSFSKELNYSGKQIVKLIQE